MPMPMTMTMTVIMIKTPVLTQSLACFHFEGANHKWCSWRCTLLFPASQARLCKRVSFVT